MSIKRFLAEKAVGLIVRIEGFLPPPRRAPDMPQPGHRRTFDPPPADAASILDRDPFLQELDRLQAACASLPVPPDQELFAKPDSRER